MKRKLNPDIKRAAALSEILAAIMLFLSAMLIRGSIQQFRTGHMVSGCISIVGALVFFAVGLVLLHDLRKRLQGYHKHQEDPHG